MRDTDTWIGGYVEVGNSVIYARVGSGAMAGSGSGSGSEGGVPNNGMKEVIPGSTHVYISNDPYMSSVLVSWGAGYIGPYEDNTAETPISILSCAMGNKSIDCPKGFGYVSFEDNSCNRHVKWDTAHSTYKITVEIGYSAYKDNGSPLPGGEIKIDCSLPEGSIKGED